MTKKSTNIASQTPANSEVELIVTGRRRVLEMMGMAAVALPVLGLQACGSDEGSAPASSAMDKVEPAMKDVAAKAESATASMAEQVKATAEDASQSVEAAAEEVESEVQEAASQAQTIATDAMAQLDENGPQAMGLGYKHDATTVDNARYKSGQQCSNCVLFQGGSSEWGGCPLFTGKQVKATGWCSAYSAAG
ncbi:high-potential iron-sulfur protein [Congregibacter variabilis]|uniref:High-potential iron-sulfur protein n=1 Tax=Congregibacter variabilis TaxID=3081200 RepID=A0ABZ0HYA3_9GAMM|nr:high-potential iron-sulfur protein [Congregibacter sp. IMCC43200]